MGYDDTCAICMVSGCTEPGKTLVTCPTCYIKIKNADTDQEKAIMDSLARIGYIPQKTCNYCKKITLGFDTFICNQCEHNIDKKSLRNCK